MSEERWKPVPASRIMGVPAGYEASSLGRVRRSGGSVLTATPDKDGYLYVTLARRRIAVHVAVCLAFKGKPEVRHLSRDRQDNRPAKLAWGSHWENEQDKKEQKGIWKREKEWEPPGGPGTHGTGDLP